MTEINIINVNDSIEYTNAIEMSQNSQENAIPMFEKIISIEDENGELQKVKEQAIYRLAELYIKIGKTQSLKSLLQNIQPFLSTIPKAKTAKIVRTILTSIPTDSQNTSLTLLLCNEIIDWCKQEKRTFLRHRIESRKASLFLHLKQYKDALRFLQTLTKEVKAIDDKHLLVEVFLIESRVYMECMNVAKAKASLTAARSASNAMYCSPELQAEIDFQSGIISAAETDFKTSFSYFYEAFEGFQSVIGRKVGAVRALKYMLLAKILSDELNDVYSIINGKVGMKFPGPDLEAMRAIANSYKKRSLHEFQDTLKQYKKQLVEDRIVESYLKRVYDTLLEKNLLRIIEPYEKVEISHIAHCMRMDSQFIERTLSGMILDHKLNGILDQGFGHLIVFEKEPDFGTHVSSLAVIKELGNAVEKLMKKAQMVHV